MIKPPAVRLDLVAAKKLMAFELRRLERKVTRVVDEQQEEARAAVAGLQRVLSDVSALCGHMRKKFELSGLEGLSLSTKKAGRATGAATKTARAARKVTGAARPRRRR